MGCLWSSESILSNVLLCSFHELPRIVNKIIKKNFEKAKTAYRFNMYFPKDNGIENGKNNKQAMLRATVCHFVSCRGNTPLLSSAPHSKAF